MRELLPSVDLDDSWAYLRAQNDRAWESAPSVIRLATERLVEVMDLAGVARGTVFVVGRDAQTPDGIRAIRTFLDRGLEVADHSFDHRGELAAQSLEVICLDLKESGDAIAQVTGALPMGFRCPSFGASENLTKALVSLGYRYDASALPSPLMPLLRLYHRATAGKGDHPPSYGNLNTAFGPLRPTRQQGISFIPTTTMPLVRTPFHGSYLTALMARSPSIADAYVNLADRVCRVFDLPVSFILHPTDVLDSTDAPHLAYFPGMAVSWRVKRRFMAGALGKLMEGRITSDMRASVRAGTS